MPMKTKKRARAQRVGKTSLAGRTFSVELEKGDVVRAPPITGLPLRAYTTILKAGRYSIPVDAEIERAAEEEVALIDCDMEEERAS